MPEKDPQREGVYEWETEFRDWNRKTLTLPEVREYVRTACAYYELEAPPIRPLPGKQYAYLGMGEGWGRGHMGFSEWCCNPAIALHESAHFIVGHLCPRAADHGPTWLGIYMWLLEKAAVAPVEALAASARKHNLKWRHLPPEIFKCRE